MSEKDTYLSQLLNTPKDRLMPVLIGDLKTPLGHILGSASMLENIVAMNPMLDAPELQVLLEAILKETRTAISRLEAFTEYDRIQKSPDDGA